jgi:AcrR family transcriptional regulator
MKSDVKTPPPVPRRQYDSSRRKAAAAETRAAIVRAARRLFLDRGYAGATMPAIADAAGVALDTVYAAVGAKPVLFRLLIELAISGEDEPVAADERAYVQTIRAEPDPRRKLAGYAHAVRMIQSRLAPLFVVLREAARSTPELAALWTEIAERRAGNMRRFVAEVAAAAGGLRSGMTIEEAADLVWTTNGPEFYLLLVEERGWDPERFERWLAELWIRMLLP